MQSGSHDLTHSEVGHLDIHVAVDQKIGGLDIMVDDVVGVKVVKAVGDMTCHVGKSWILTKCHGS